MLLNIISSYSSLLNPPLSHLSLLLLFPPFRFRWLKLVKAGKKIPLKEDDKDRVEKLQERLTEALAAKESAKTNEEKLASALACDEAKADIKKVCYSV